MERLKNIITKLEAMRAVMAASRLRPVHKVTLWQMLFEPERYAGLAEGLVDLPMPDVLRLGRKRLPVPQTLEDFTAHLCYGQKLYLTTAEPFDVGIILRYVAGYFYPLATGRTWDERRALLFGKKVLSSPVIDLYPVANHLIELMKELATREQKLLHREPTKQERAAGVDRLTKFAELTNLLFLMASFACDEATVQQKPYDECLVRFMLQKEQNAYAERLQEVYRKEAEPKKK